MSGKTKAAVEKPSPPADPDRPPTNVVTLPNRGLDSVPAHLRGDIEEFAGAGTSSRREDTLVPFLKIAQKGSPEVNKRDPAYIEGLEPGWVFDTATKQKWCAEEGDGPLMVQFYFEPCEVEWGLRDTPDKGYKGRHPADTPLLGRVREVEKETGRGVLRLLPARDAVVGTDDVPGSKAVPARQLVTTRYHYMVLARELRPIALALSGSGLQASRALNHALRGKKVRGVSGLVVAPSFATLLRLRTVWVKDGEYDWFVPVIEDLGWLPDEFADAYEEAKLMFRSAVESGVRTADLDEETGGVAAGAASGDKVDGADPDADPGDDSPL
jgi:hypothetical protein